MLKLWRAVAFARKVIDADEAALIALTVFVAIMMTMIVIDDNVSFWLLSFLIKDTVLD